MPHAAGKQIGVLALQGGFARHITLLEKCGASPLTIRYPEELSSCSGLVIPGGESTTLHRCLEVGNWEESLIHFSRTKPLFGTCAGMIVMANLGMLPITLQRNAYGRQIDSFIASIEIHLSAESVPFSALFIRAPKILTIETKEVEVLATYENAPVLIETSLHLAASFHPELTENPLIHHHFLKKCQKNLESPLQPVH